MPEAPYRWWLFILAALAAAAPLRSSDAQFSDKEAALKACLALTDETRRLGCLKNLTFGEQVPPTSSNNASHDIPSAPPQLQSASSGQVIAGQWRLVRTPNPKVGKDTLSLMHTAELSGSDPNFAGMVVRCAEQKSEVLLVFVRPFPPRAKLQIDVEGRRYDGTVVPPGAEILLAGAFEDLQIRWLSRPQIRIMVEHDGDNTKGIVLLDGLDAALAALKAACAAHR
jgi:hypothetical protein